MKKIEIDEFDMIVKLYETASNVAKDVLAVSRPGLADEPRFRTLRDHTILLNEELRKAEILIRTRLKEKQGVSVSDKRVKEV